MKYSWQEIDQLAEILAAEAEGREVDRSQARRLADLLADACPDIRKTMELVSRRMADSARMAA